VGEKMKNAPIFYTLGQIRFNPILDMHAHIEALQVEFRKSGLSGFNVDSVPSIQVDTSSIPPKLTHANQQRWRFTNSRRNVELVLLTNSIVLQTTNYGTEDEFISRILNFFGVVHKEVNLDFVDQIGFRTLDAILPDDKHSLDALLRPELLGFYSSRNGELKQNVLEGSSQIGSTGVLVRRVVILHGPLGLPLDLMPITLEINPKFTSTNSWHAILDTDSADRQQIEVDFSNIEERLRSVKKIASNAFYGAVTETALAFWR
jgi:uncharacterized protein (TIGR04255 family)